MSRDKGADAIQIRETRDKVQEKEENLSKCKKPTVPELDPRLTALCLSGGGIRSAIFNLGVLQGLAKYSLLPSFAYLSTVSGGGFIGAWLSAWIKRVRGKHEKHVGAARANAIAIEEISEKLCAPLSSKDKDDDPIDWLRRYSNYLTPKVGLFSTDFWTVVATILRNLFLNWLLVVPFLAGLLMIPRLWEAVLQLKPAGALIDWMFRGGVVLSVAAIAAARLALPSTNFPDKGKRIFFELSIGLTVVMSLAASLYWNFFVQYAATDRPAWSDLPWFCLFGLTLHVAGWLLGGVVQFFFKKKDVKTQVLKKAASSPNPWQRLLAFLAPLLPFLVVLITGATGGFVLLLGVVELAPLLIFDKCLYTTFAAPVLILLFLLCVSLYIGILSRWIEHEVDLEWFSRAGARILVLTFLWFVLSCLVFFGPAILAQIPVWAKQALGSVGVIAGLVSALGRFKLESSVNEPDKDRSGSWGAFLIGLVPEMAALLFTAILLLALISATEWLGERALLLGKENLWRRLNLSLIFFGVAILWGFFVDVNKFSLNAMYSGRIVQAFLGATRKRSEDPSTGMDPDDDLELDDLSNQIPLHVVNVTLNLVQTKNLAWQERKAASFTFSPSYSGSSNLAYVESCGYRRTRDGISFGKAISISGAAASPNMGSYSSPLLAFLMTLCNARLGWWLRNPKWLRKPDPSQNENVQSFKNLAPRHALWPLIAEALGLTHEDRSYVYLSDGGHFENLGLFEMVKRGCRLILVCDASCDPDHKLGDLGQAVRKIRTDLGVEISFTEDNLELIGWRAPAKASRHCCIGRIRYREGKEGTLIYLKPCSTGDEPIEVLEYQTRNSSFPHESTADQWFGESQFESYRLLGLHSIESIFLGKEDKAEYMRAFKASEDNLLAYAAGQYSRKFSTGPITHAGGIVYRKNKEKPEFLLVKSRGEGSHQDWVFPKGHIVGEEVKEPGITAIREVREEAGVVAEIKSFLTIVEFQKPSEHVRCAVYLMECVKEDTKSEEREPDWVLYEKALSKASFPEVVEALKMAQDTILRMSERDHNDAAVS